MQRRNVLASKIGLQPIKVNILPVINHLFQYRAVFYRSFSVQHQGLKTKAFRKKEFPRYQAEQKPTNQTDWLKRKINKKIV